MSRDERGQGVPALSTSAVTLLTGVPISTLNFWISKGLCKPTVLPGSGHRYERFWAPADVVVVQVIRSLRQAGCSMQNVRRVKSMIHSHWDAGLGEMRLIYDGSDVLVFHGDAVYSALKHPGQSLIDLALVYVDLPIGYWSKQIMEQAEQHLVDPKSIRQQRRARASSRRRPRTARLLA